MFNSCLEIIVKLLLTILVLCLFINVEVSANLLESDVANGEEKITSIATEDADNKDDISVTKEKQNQYKKNSPAKKLNAAQLFEQQMLAKKKNKDRKIKKSTRKNSSSSSKSKRNKSNRYGKKSNTGGRRSSGQPSLSSGMFVK